jgi:hypothetical protein
MNLQNLWKQHGTKLLGSVTVALGTIAVATPAEFSVFGIHGHTALRITVIAAGLLTVVRGFTNVIPPVVPPATPPPTDNGSTKQ